MNPRRPVARCLTPAQELQLAEDSSSVRQFDTSRARPYIQIAVSFVREIIFVR